MVQTLSRGVEILLIIQEKGSASIAEIASELGVNKSTASRLVSTLMEYDMVSIDSVTKKYRLGFRILHLSEGVKRNFDICSIARPYLHKICEETNESVHLAIMGNRKMYILDQVLSKREYNVSAQVGMIESWHCSSVGKCVLAYKSPSFIKEILTDYDYKAYTDKTISCYEDLENELAIMRDQGYALDDEEVTVGVRCLAVPVLYFGAVKCCIGISAPKEELTEDSIKKYVKVMKKYCKEISTQLTRDI